MVGLLLMCTWIPTLSLYTTLDNIGQNLEFGSGTMLFKVDVSGTFRRIRMDTGDTDLLGIQHITVFISHQQSYIFGSSLCNYYLHELFPITINKGYKSFIFKCKF